MVEAIAQPCVEKLVDYTITPIFRQFKYLFRYNGNIRNFKAKVQNLEKKREAVQVLVDEAKRNALVIISEVEEWLKDVDNLKEEADEVLNSATNSEMRCLFLRCPNLKTRYLLSRNATKKTAEIVGLQEAGRNFVEVGKRAPLKLLPYHGSEALKSRISTKKEIIKALEDKDISIVGICGLPGVGKTTMANEIRTQVEGELFDEVAMVVVSKDVDIIRIQDKLADMLGLKFDERTNEIVRASRLAERLTQDNEKRILVILDDLWTEFDLKTLGILPLSHLQGLKILLTSRYEHVCKDTGALRNIKVGVLPSNEAFLFLQDVAEISKISNDAIELKAIAKQVAEECKGLPLALEVVGKSLRNRELHAWRDALNRLRNSQHSDKVFSSIQLSYDYLESDDKSLLLLCSLFPEDVSIPIEILVRYARGLERFQLTETLSDTRDRAYTVSDNLKSCHLLLSGQKEEEVKLHDVIRDFCLSIASKGEERYMVKHGLRTGWPEHDTHESYSAISLTFREMIWLPSRLQYGNLKLLRFLHSRLPYSVLGFLQLQEGYLHGVDIPEEFLDDLQELRVLDFSGVNIRSPIQLSAGLRTLCLNDCYLEFGISFFGSLKKLEILTFHGSVLSGDFPHDEMVELSNLRLLDLWFKKGPRPVPPGFLFGMKKLEELYLGDYFYIRYEEKEHIIKEVSSLKALNTLQICTDDTQFLMQLLQACSEKLKRFDIIRRDKLLASTKHLRRSVLMKPGIKSLNLYNIDRNLLMEPGIKSLMRRSDELFLSAEGWKNPFIESVEDGFINLESLVLNLLSSEYLIDTAGSIPSGIFCNLKHLVLRNMPDLKEICNGNLLRVEHLTRPAPFCKLRSIRVSNCEVIKRLFSESVAKCMVNLQNLGIYTCPSLEEVVSVDTQENEITESLSFPKLKELQLHDLSRVQCFRSQSNAVGLCQTLLNQVELPSMECFSVIRLHSITKLLSVEMPFGSLNSLREMEVVSCDNLVNIAQSNSIKLLQNLETLQVDKCRELNVIFDFEGLNVDIDDVEISMLGQLKTLKLREGRSLLHIVRMVPEGIRVFQNLKSLKVKACNRLRYLFPASMINSFVGLETLSVKFCDKMEEIFGRRGGGGGAASKIEFRQLRSIELIHLPRFKMFCSHNYELVFPSLDRLRIEDCPVMTEFCSGQLNAPKLEKVQIGEDEYIDRSNFLNL